MPPSPTTPSTESDNPQAPKRARWLLRVVLGLILALVVLDLVALQLARGSLRRAEQRVEAEGSSLKLDVLFPEVEAPAVKAYGYLEAARQIFEAQGESETPRQALSTRIRTEIHSFPFRETVTAEDLELFRRGVEHFRLVLDIVDAALPAERAHFGFDRQVPIFEAHDPYDLFSRLWISDLLSARVRLALAEGRGDEAWHNVQAIFRLATWCSQEMPTLIHQLIATAVVRQATAEAMDLLRHAVPNQEEMDHVLAEARRWDPQMAYDISLAGDRASIVTSLLDERVLERMAVGEPLLEDFPETQVAPWLLSRPLRPWLHWNLAAYIDAMAKLAADCRQPGYRREKLVGEERRLEELYPVPSWATLARPLLTSNYFDACNKRDQTLVGIDLMEIAFRLEDHRRRDGFFSLGGMTAVDVHGATVEAPIFAETATVFEIMGPDGKVEIIDAGSTKVDGVSPLRFVRVSLGRSVS